MSEHIVIPNTGTVTLTWVGDELIDWMNGNRYRLDGSCSDGRYFTGYRFDAAVSLPDGEVAVLYTRTGTKGVVFHDGKIVREINRSYYFADSYEYPICLWRDEGGRPLIAHCPEDYNRIEIEDAVGGERLTASEDREPNDFFYSRLQINRACTHLLSAGWVWHPLDFTGVCTLKDALSDPRHLDRPQDGWRDDGGGE